MNSNRNKNIFNVTTNNNCEEQNMSRNSNLFNVTTNSKEVSMNRPSETVNGTSESGLGTVLGVVFLIGSILLILGFAYIHWGSPKSVPIQDIQLTYIPNGLAIGRKTIGKNQMESRLKIHNLLWQHGI